MIRHRAAVPAALAAAALALAGCGGGDDKGGSPLDDALGYLPEDSPAVVVVETDPEGGQWKQANELISKFQIAAQIRDEGKRRVAPPPLDFDEDLGPQLGNEVAIGKPEAGGERRSYVAAVKLKDTGAAESDLLPKLKRRRLEARIDGDMLVVATSRELLDKAIEGHGDDDRLTEDEFDDDLGRLAEGDPLVRATGDLEAALEGGDDAAVRSLPWVKSLRRFAAAGSARENGLALDFDVRTEETPAADLPFAPGPQSPPVPRRQGEIAIGAREPARTLGLVNRLKDVLPRTKDHANALNDALDRIGVDIQRDLIDQIGDLGAASFPLDGTYVARADLKDPTAFAKTLRTISDRLAGAAQGDVGFTMEPGGGPGFYRLNADRGRQLYIGVVGDQVAIGEEAGRARDFAEEAASPVPGARGSVALFANAESVADALIERRASGPLALLGQVLTDPLGDLKGWMETTPTGLTGHAELEIE